MKTILSSRGDHYLARLSIFLITLALIAGMAGCDGCTPSQNLEIRDWYDLDAVRNNLRGHHILMNDLDSTTAGYEELASPTANQGKGWQPIGWGYWAWTPFGDKVLGEIFKGTFDGQGYEIRDLYINGQGQVGLFGFVAEGGIIENITLINATVTTDEAVGGLMGLNEDTVRCLDVASVVGVGGLVGYNGGTVSDCYAIGNITGDSGVGGLVGWNEGTVSNSYFSGNVTGREAIGGLVGYNQGTVTYSYSRGNVTGNWTIGGLVGGNSGTVSNSYYNYDEVLINGKNIITIGALFSEDFEEWLDTDKFLDVNQRLSQENSYYLINDIRDFKQLLAFGQDDTLKFRLTNDLDLGDEANFYIPYLAEEFNGNGHKISNLSFDFGFISQVGLFGYLASGGKVSQVGVEEVDITGYSGVGGLVGENSGTVINSYSTGSVTGNDVVGGLVGDSNFGSVSNSYSTGNVTGSTYVGGLVGHNKGGNVNNSYSTGSVTGDWDGGGLVGWNDGTVSNSYSTSNVASEQGAGGLVGWNTDTVSNSYSTGSRVTGDGNVAGLVGSNLGTVSDSYSSCNVTGDWQVGGLVGWNNGTVSNCYSTGSVTANENEDVGGLVGDNYEGNVSKSFWDIETSGQATSDGGTGKITTGMQDITTFSGAGWDITAVASPGTRNSSYIWNIVNGVTYPFLSWQP
jgi:hypothetical protein